MVVPKQYWKNEINVCDLGGISLAIPPVNLIQD
jgi:hypothetical protein